MRKFLVEMEQEITLDELRAYYESDAERMERDEGIETFERYLELCMFWNNGSLTEILTPETPRGEELHAVSLCRVQYSEDALDFCEEWLTPTEICEKWRDGCGIKFLI